MNVEDVEEQQKNDVYHSLKTTVQDILEAFGASLTSTYGVHHQHPNQSHAQQEHRYPRTCIGHKERILGCDFSECGMYLATASQESTVRIWKTSTNQLLSTINLNVNHEALRVVWASASWSEQYLAHRNHVAYENNTEGRKISSCSFTHILATGGADGLSQLYGTTNMDECKRWDCLETLDHTSFLHFQTRLLKDPNDKPQIYSLQFIDNFPSGCGSPSFLLLTSSDDHIHLWEMGSIFSVNNSTRNSLTSELKISSPTVTHASTLRPILREKFSLRFTSDYNEQQEGFGVKLCVVTNDNTNLEHRDELFNGFSNIYGNTYQESYNQVEGKTFGGQRNPLNLIYVFDASFCPSNGLLGAALSDGTLRLMNVEGTCLSILRLPDNQSHLTSFTWDDTGRNLATCVGSGQLVTWRIEIFTLKYTNDQDCSDVHGDYIQVVPSWRTIFSGGHLPGSPIFGAKFLSSNHQGLTCATDQVNEVTNASTMNITDSDPLLLTWGADGRICLWDALAEKVVISPVSILRQNTDYPIFTLAITQGVTIFGKDTSSHSTKAITIAVGGGGTDGSFIGIPVFLYDVHPLSKNTEK